MQELFDAALLAGGRYLRGHGWVCVCVRVCTCAYLNTHQHSPPRCIPPKKTALHLRKGILGSQVNGEHWGKSRKPNSVPRKTPLNQSHAPPGAQAPPGRGDACLQPHRFIAREGSPRAGPGMALMQDTAERAPESWFCSVLRAASQTDLERSHLPQNSPCPPAPLWCAVTGIQDDRPQWGRASDGRGQPSSWLTRRFQGG